MTGEEDSQRRRDALLAMHAQGPAQEQQRQQQVAPPPVNLAQLRPTVVKQVGDQERQAEMVVRNTWNLFVNAVERS